MDWRRHSVRGAISGICISRRRWKTNAAGSIVLSLATKPMTGSDHSDLNVAEVIRAASREDLIKAWRRAYGRPPPPGVSRQLLEHAAAWSMQAKQHGGLARSTVARLKRIAEQDEDAVAKAKPTTAAGSRFVRGWNGKTHIVDVTDDGFLYAGKTYRSLSAVARTITGARWSGPRFFGLNGKAQAMARRRGREQMGCRQATSVCLHCARHRHSDS